MQLQQMQAQMQQQAMTGMPAQPNPMMEQLQVTIESRKSKLIAEMTKDFMEEEKQQAIVYYLYMFSNHVLLLLYSTMYVDHGLLLLVVVLL